jgi:hypothetical protein
MLSESPPSSHPASDRCLSCRRPNGDDHDDGCMQAEHEAMLAGDPAAVADHEPDECYHCLLNEETASDCRCRNCCRRLIIETCLQDAEVEPRIKERGSPIYTGPEFTASGERDLAGYLLNGKDGPCVSSTTPPISPRSTPRVRWSAGCSSAMAARRRARGPDRTSLLVMARESFNYPPTGQLLDLLDEAARRSGVSRGQAFEDFLHVSVCALSGGAMEDEYLAVVGKHSNGKKGSRGCDSLAHMFGELVEQMEETRGEMKDVLGDLFQGAITYGEAGQFLTPEPITRMMAKISTADFVPEEGKTPSVCDPCCGSGRLLLAVAEEHRHWQFVGQDVDLRCVRMTALNLAFRNLYGYVIHGDSLALEQRLVYRTGFNGRGFARPIALEVCPAPVLQTASEEPAEVELWADDAAPRSTNQLRLF